MCLSIIDAFFVDDRILFLRFMKMTRTTYEHVVDEVARGRILALNGGDYQEATLNDRLPGGCK